MEYYTTKSCPCQVRTGPAGGRCTNDLWVGFEFEPPRGVDLNRSPRTLTTAYPLAAGISCVLPDFFPLSSCSMKQEGRWLNESGTDFGAGAPSLRRSKIERLFAEGDSRADWLVLLLRSSPVAALSGWRTGSLRPSRWSEAEWWTYEHVSRYRSFCFLTDREIPFQVRRCGCSSADRRATGHTRRYPV